MWFCAAQIAHSQFTMHDTIIRGGVLIDGTGAQRRSADLAISDGMIAEIGKVSSPARQVIDADGAIVSPGFIDIHTHYDGQFLWDDRIDPSFSHGVTTAIAGNCGVGFAPVNEFRQELIELMEGVVDIPGLVLDEGLDWDWTSFPDYLDRLGERRYAMDVASHVTHAPIRLFVMGERALRHEQATADDIAAMADLVRQGMAAGAMGFSNGRIATHASSKGAAVPGTFAEEDELLALARAMGESGRGVFQTIPRGTNGAAVIEAMSHEERRAEHALLERLALTANRPLTYTLLQYAADPHDFESMISASLDAARRGAILRPQIAARPLSVIQMLDTYHVFLRRPAYREIAHLPRDQRAAAMRDPVRREAILGGEDVDGEYAANPPVIRMLRAQLGRLGGTYVLADPSDYEPDEARRVDHLAVAAGKSVQEFIYDHYAQGEGSNYNVSLTLNYAQGSLDHVHAAMQDTNTVNGLADGGAHVRLICDASSPTYALSFWARDRKRGPTISLEHVAKRMTADSAQLYGLKDRGVLAVGKRADINVFDPAQIGLEPPRVVNDLPSGGSRLLQDSRGYLATLVRGEVTRCEGEDTGTRPGRLVRAR